MIFVGRLLIVHLQLRLFYIYHIRFKDQTMTMRLPNSSPWNTDELRQSLDEVRAETVMLVLPGLIIVGFLFVLVAPLFRDPLVGGLLGVGMIGLALAVWWLFRISYHLAVWVLIAATTGFAMKLMQVHPQIGLGFLALPIGFMTLFCDVRISVLGTIAASVVIMLGPAPATSVDETTLTRVFATLQIWIVFWLIWLATHLLLRQWSGTTIAMARTANGLNEHATINYV
jgi:hypothetical protein